MGLKSERNNTLILVRKEDKYVASSLINAMGNWNTLPQMVQSVETDMPESGSSQMHGLVIKPSLCMSLGQEKNIHLTAVWSTDILSKTTNNIVSVV